MRLFGLAADNDGLLVFPAIFSAGPTDRGFGRHGAVISAIRIAPAHRLPRRIGFERALRRAAQCRAVGPVQRLADSLPRKAPPSAPSATNCPLPDPICEPASAPSPAPSSVPAVCFWPPRSPQAPTRKATMTRGIKFFMTKAFSNAVHFVTPRMRHPFAPE